MQKGIKNKHTRNHIRQKEQEKARENELNEIKKEIDKT